MFIVENHFFSNKVVFVDFLNHSNESLKIRLRLRLRSHSLTLLFERVYKEAGARVNCQILFFKPGFFWQTSFIASFRRWAVNFPSRSRTTLSAILIWGCLSVNEKYLLVFELWFFRGISTDSRITCVIVFQIIFSQPRQKIGMSRNGFIRVWSNACGTLRYPPRRAIRFLTESVGDIRDGICPIVCILTVAADRRG